MIVMPANSVGWFWHILARESGKLGHLYSPGAESGPWSWFPYAFDNGCFAMWNQDDNTFNEAEWMSIGLDAWRRLMFWGQAANQKPLWAITPDRPGNWDETMEKWYTYANQNPFTLAVAVQDGATPDAVRSLKPSPQVICVGGSTEWKWGTVEMWAREFSWVHVLRVNSPTKLTYLSTFPSIKSCDGTGWNRGDKAQTRGLEEWAMRSPKPYTHPLWPNTCRSKRKNERNQMTFAA